jgi:uncharacterized protein
VTGAERIVSIDVLRGVALLGILVMNVQSFAMIEAAYMNPTAYGDLAGADFVVWLLSHVFADQKFMTIFSMLFGAGILLMAERAEDRGRRSAPAHYRRMGWLILFGLLHAYLLWYGDILYFYGMCGFVVYLFRRLRPTWLIVLGLLAVAVPSLLFTFFGWTMQFWADEQLVEMARDWAPPPDAIEKQLEIYRGGWLDQMELRAPSAGTFQTFIFLIWGAWRAGGLMLVGMALYKLGVFGARLSRLAYLILVGAGVVAGIPLVLLGVYRNFAAGWSVEYSQFYGSQFNYWASLLVSAGWVGAVMLVCKRGALPWLTDRLAAVGQTAFSNYILHSVVCTTVFYGHGLGLFGRVDRVAQAGIVLGIWVLQLIVSPLWLRRFRFGPLEWLWRSLTYWRLQPLRRER